MALSTLKLSGKSISDGKSFLHHAVLSGNLAIVSAVLQRNGFSDEPDLEGNHIFAFIMPTPAFLLVWVNVQLRDINDEESLQPVYDAPFITFPL